MDIVYFYQYFSTPQGSWGTRVFEFGKRWVAQGHKVTVISSIYYKSDLQASGISSRYNYEGVDVIVLNIAINNKHSIGRRIKSFLSYALLSSIYSLILKADVVIASSGPITVTIPGLAARLFRGCKLIMEVRDLWPEGAIEMDIIKDKRAQRAAYKLAKTSYDKAAAVVTLSPGMKQYLQDKYGYNHVYAIPNAADNDLFGTPTPFTVPREYIGKKIYLYTGNIGEVNNSYLILNAAKQLKERDDILFLFIGDGQLKEELVAVVEREGLGNVKFLGLMPKSELVGWVQASYYMLVPLQPKPILDTSSPNKLFDAFAAGVPVIQTTQGWIKEDLDQYNAGLTINGGKPEELVEAVLQTADNQQLRDEQAKNAKYLATSHYDRDLLSQRMLNIIEKVASS